VGENGGESVLPAVASTKYHVHREQQLRLKQAALAGALAEEPGAVMVVDDWRWPVVLGANR
jgi:hypothetical protein